MADKDLVVDRIEGDELVVVRTIAVEDDTARACRQQLGLEFEVGVRPELGAKVERADGSAGGADEATTCDGPARGRRTAHREPAGCVEVVGIVKRQVWRQDLNREVVHLRLGAIVAGAHQAAVEAHGHAILDPRREGVAEPVHTRDRHRDVRAVDGKEHVIGYASLQLDGLVRLGDLVPAAGVAVAHFDLVIRDVDTSPFEVGRRVVVEDDIRVGLPARQRLLSGDLGRDLEIDRQVLVGIEDGSRLPPRCLGFDRHHAARD
ncbi:hypothetical protein D9M70_458310 [compost metagenome]